MTAEPHQNMHSLNHKIQSFWPFGVFRTKESYFYIYSGTYIKVE